MVLPPTAGFPCVPLTQAHQVQCQQQGIYLTPDLYIVKLLVQPTHSQSTYCLLLLADPTTHRSAPLTAHMTLMTIWRLLLLLLVKKHSEGPLLSLFIGCRAEVEMLDSVMLSCNKFFVPFPTVKVSMNASVCLRFGFCCSKELAAKYATYEQLHATPNVWQQYTKTLQLHIFDQAWIIETRSSLSKNLINY